MFWIYFIKHTERDKEGDRKNEFSAYKRGEVLRGISLKYIGTRKREKELKKIANGKTCKLDLLIYDWFLHAKFILNITYNKLIT